MDAEQPGGTVYAHFGGKALSLMDGVDLSVGIHHERDRHEYDRDDQHDGQIQQQVHRTRALLLKAHGYDHLVKSLRYRGTNQGPLDRDGEFLPFDPSRGFWRFTPRQLQI